jgi:hypothetical protein
MQAGVIFVVEQREPLAGGGRPKGDLEGQVNAGGITRLGEAYAPLWVQIPRLATTCHRDAGGAAGTNAVETTSASGSNPAGQIADRE